MNHNWVRHTVKEVDPVRHPSGVWAGVDRSEAEARTAIGCDNCGLPLSDALMEEPCIANLIDELEEIESGT